MFAFRPNWELNWKFLTYLFQTKRYFDYKKQYARWTKVIRVPSKNIEKFLIPIPPLDKQQSIVAILDKFDTLVNDLSVWLPAEIQARRQQYEYYRNKLLTFKPLEK
jgi:type I restriction enzyme S subunit